MNQNPNPNSDMQSVLNRMAEAMSRMADAMTRIADALEASARNALRDRPRMKLTFPIEQLNTLNFSEYGYEPLGVDKNGIPEAIRCVITGKIFKRHNGNPKFGHGVIYSCPDGKKEDGSTNYEVAMIFSSKVTPPEPVPAAVLKALAPALPPGKKERDMAQECREIAKLNDPDALLKHVREWMAMVGEPAEKHKGARLSDVVRYMLNTYGNK